MTKTISLTISGMHCVSCAMNIDGELEDTGKIESVSTKYATGVATITFDPTRITPDEIIAEIARLGYTASLQE